MLLLDIGQNNSILGTMNCLRKAKHEGISLEMKSGCWNRLERILFSVVQQEALTSYAESLSCRKTKRIRS